MNKNLLIIIKDLDKKRKIVNVSKDLTKITNFKDIKGTEKDLTEIILLFDALFEEYETPTKDFFKNKKITDKKLEIAVKDLIERSENNEYTVDNDFERAYFNKNLDGDKKTLVKLLYIMEAISTRKKHDSVDFFLQRGIFGN